MFDKLPLGGVSNTFLISITWYFSFIISTERSPVVAIPLGNCALLIIALSLNFTISSPGTKSSSKLLATTLSVLIGKALIKKVVRNINTIQRHRILTFVFFSSLTWLLLIDSLFINPLIKYDSKIYF